MRLIPLTRGYSAIVDDDQYEFLAQWQIFATLPDRKICGTASQMLKANRSTKGFVGINSTENGSLRYR